jgi:hypothetical protein
MESASNIGKVIRESTYRFLSLVTFRCIDRVVVLCDMQVQKVLIRKILLAFGTSVHVRFLIVDIICIE